MQILRFAQNDSQGLSMAGARFLHLLSRGCNSEGPVAPAMAGEMPANHQRFTAA